LIFSLKDNDLNIQFNHVVEHDGYYLIHVQLPDLMSVQDDESVAKLVIPADAGRLVDVNTSNIKEYDLEEFGPIVPVLDSEKLLKVQDSCIITVSVKDDFDDDGSVSWVDGAKWLREKVDATPNPFYQNKTFVRTFVDRPPTSRDPTGLREELPFDEVLERIKEFASQTDSAACVMYLLGWQYEGHDSGYPSVDKVNENLGGYDHLVNLISEAKKYNVTVTFYDNYDDSYPNHPGWDPEVICRDPQGNLMKGGVWEGNQSYLISPYKYAVKSDRI
jgi:hypothetical protein